MDRLIRVRSPLLTESLIDVLSSGYLDVSVPRVRSKPPMYSGVKYLAYPIDDDLRQQQQNIRWVPPFGDPWIKAYSRLPMA
jgi:hypothetical protein